MNEEDFIRHYGKRPVLEVYWSVKDNGEVSIDKDSILAKLEELMLVCEVE